MTARVDAPTASASAAPPAVRAPRSRRAADDVAQPRATSGSACSCFVLPFLALLFHSLRGAARRRRRPRELPAARSAASATTCCWSLKIAGLTLVIEPRWSACRRPTRSSATRSRASGSSSRSCTLPLYVPGAVIGLSLLLTYNFTYHLPTSMWGLVLAMAVGHVPADAHPDRRRAEGPAARVRGGGGVPRRDRAGRRTGGSCSRSSARACRRGLLLTLHHRLQRVPGDAVRPPGRASRPRRCGSSTCPDRPASRRRRPRSR